MTELRAGNRMVGMRRQPWKMNRRDARLLRHIETRAGVNRAKAIQYTPSVTTSFSQLIARRAVIERATFCVMKIAAMTVQAPTVSRAGEGRERRWAAAELKHLH